MYQILNYVTGDVYHGIFNVFCIKYTITDRSSWEQMTQQPESLGLSGLSAFWEVIGRIHLDPKILSPERMEIQPGLL